jgi:hypothetical protein
MIVSQIIHKNSTGDRSEDRESIFISRESSGSVERGCPTVTCPSSLHLASIATSFRHRSSPGKQNDTGLNHAYTHTHETDRTIELDTRHLYPHSSEQTRSREAKSSRREGKQEQRNPCSSANVWKVNKHNML